MPPYHKRPFLKEIHELTKACPAGLMDPGLSALPK